MLYLLLSICSGIGLASLLPVVSHWLLVASIGLSVLAAIAYRQSKRPLLVGLFGLGLGFAWGINFGLNLLEQQLPSALERQVIRLEGEVLGLPLGSFSQGQAQLRFEFKIRRFDCPQAACNSFPKLIRLTWREPPPIAPGQSWQLSVKLKRAHGFMNPGALDYQSWLIRQGIMATGYVLSDESARLIDERASVDYWRWRLSRYLDQTFSSLEYGGLLKALLIADQRAIQNDDWELFRQQGVMHLMVISGLHISLVTGLVFFASRMMLLLLAGLPTPAPISRLCSFSALSSQVDRLAALCAISSAGLYCVAAGASLPTRRAFIMVSCFMLLHAVRRRALGGTSLALALTLCLLFDPLAVCSPSLWLSFLAVAILSMAVSGRVQRLSTLVNAVRCQCLLFIGLLVPAVLSQGAVALTAPLVNILFVPLFSLLIVPLNAIALMTALLSEQLAFMLWRWADYLLGLAMSSLRYLDQQAAEFYMTMPGIPWGLQLLALAGAGVLLLPAGFSARRLGLLLILPLFFYRAPVPELGSVRVTVLDVGQGLSVLIQTTHHSLVYDVAARFPQGNGRAFVVAEVSLLPVMRQRGISDLDTLILSHGDNDHAGGWRSVQEHYPAARIFSGEGVAGLRAEACDGQHWQWDGVRFQLASLVTKAEQAGVEDHANNRSCILTIETASGHIILPGDIASDREMQWLRQLAQNLQRLPVGELHHGKPTRLMIAPHHGSRSSSSWALLKVFQPEHVVFSVGYLNHFGHPHPDIRARYRHFESRQHQTSKHGAVDFYFHRDGHVTVTHERDRKKRYWL